LTGGLKKFSPPLVIEFLRTILKKFLELLGVNFIVTVGAERDKIIIIEGEVRMDIEVLNVMDCVSLTVPVIDLTASYTLVVVALQNLSSLMLPFFGVVEPDTESCYLIGAVLFISSRIHKNSNPRQHGRGEDRAARERKKGRRISEVIYL
jgi:hypothetical protein